MEIEIDARAPGDGANTDLSRRGLLKGVAALPLAAVLANPALAEIAAATMTDVEITTQEWGGTASASLALPTVTPAPAIIMIHEWWGLNDQIKSVAVELAAQGYVALAVDMYGVPATTDPAVAGQLAGGMNEDEGRDILKSWTKWLRARDDVSGKVASVGWCFGGGWSLEAAIEAQVDAAIIYYGRVTAATERLRAINGPVLGHFATQDKFITPEMVAGFEARMAEAGKDLTAHHYDADHGFANPTTARYDEEDAKLAWQRTTAFLKQHLGRVHRPAVSFRTSRARSRIQSL